jgi:hypothetical protein
MLATLGRDLAYEIGPVDQQHLRALGRCAQRHAAPDALCRASDDDDFPREPAFKDHAGTGSLDANFS